MAHQHLHMRHAHYEQVEDDSILALQERGLTVTRTVVTTSPATFTGATAGESTLGHGATKTSDDGILHATSSAASIDKANAADTAIYSPSTSVPSTMTVLAATSTPSVMLATSVISSATASASSSALASQDSTSSGMTAGGKAGLAIGIILGLSAILSLVLFCFRQRKKAQQRQRLDDEKSRSPLEDSFDMSRAASTRTAKTASTAPRLSLRPVTQLFPMFGEKRFSRGNELATMSSPSASHLAPQSAWERSLTSHSQGDKTDPFGNHAETVDPINAEGPAVVQSITSDGPLVNTIGLARGASKRENTPRQIDFIKALPPPGPPSPSGTEFSNSDQHGRPVQTSSSAAIAAAGGPTNSAVHRVQLDFQPSMEDELELKAGQLIRLLHEYDDGWALCIRLDRSRQGVVPRTCLSTRPVKPRPAQNGPGRPPPSGMRAPQGQRRPSASSMNQGYSGPRPGSSQSNRSAGPRYTPQGRPPNGQQNLPHSPSGNMRNSPPQARSALANGNGVTTSPQGASLRSEKGSVGRKPVPGQAV